MQNENITNKNIVTFYIKRLSFSKFTNNFLLIK